MYHSVYSLNQAMISYNKSMKILRTFLSVREKLSMACMCVKQQGEKEKSLGLHREMYLGTTCLKNNST